MKIINAVGARPNFMKIAPIMQEYRKHPEIEPLLVHTGQHYDEKMSELFFRELEIPRPDINLGAGSGTHAFQTSEIMRAFEPVCLEHNPDALLVVGDVNSTIACGLTAVKLGVRLVHVEAGLRSGDRSMPEEINRVLTDAISDVLFCSEQSGVDNLLAEGREKERIHLVGQVMIDTLFKNIRKAEESSAILDELKSAWGIDPGGYSVATLHRPSNVEEPGVFPGIAAALEEIGRDYPVVFPVHPGTRRKLSGAGFMEKLENSKNIRVMEPLGYLDFIRLISSAALVLTDSGGIQEETTALRIPCITLRKNTERPVTLETGSNHLAGNSAGGIIEAYGKVKKERREDYGVPPLWDGMAAGRIVGILTGTAP